MQWRWDFIRWGQWSDWGKHDHKKRFCCTEELQYKLRRMFDFYPYEDVDAPIRVHPRRGYWVSIVMTLFTIGSLLTVLSLSMSDWSTGARGYTVNTAVVGGTDDLQLPVLTQGPGLRVAIIINPGNDPADLAKVYNESFVKVRFRQDSVSWPNGTYHKAKKDINTTKCTIGNGDYAWCPSEQGSLAGRYAKGVNFDYLRSSVEVCESYCGKAGQISCDACASQAELDALISKEMIITFYYQRIVNIVTDETAWVEIPQTFYLQSQLTSKIEIFVGHVKAEIRDKWTYGINEDDTKIKIYAGSGSQSNFRFVPYATEKALARYYLRLDSHTKSEESHTPYTLLEIITTLGGLATACAFIFGTVGTGANCLMNDDGEMPPCFLFPLQIADMSHLLLQMPSMEQQKPTLPP
jgi:hypothetical protein